MKIQLILFLHITLFMGYSICNSQTNIVLESDAKVDSIFVEKGKRLMHVFYNGQKLKTYKIGLGFQPIGHKHFEADGKTPEGHYIIDGKNPESKYHLALKISYPNRSDIDYAKARGKDPGGFIMIHGLPDSSLANGHNVLIADWTWGCIGITNEEIDELYPVVDIGTPIYIVK